MGVLVDRAALIRGNLPFPPGWGVMAHIPVLGTDEAVRGSLLISS